MELWRAVVGGLLVLAALPATTNYKLNSFGFGSGGTAGSSTSNYRVEAITGETSGTTPSTSNYAGKPGFIQTQQANVPVAPTITNPSSYYDKLHLVINPSNNPTDATFAISISDDNFATDTRYIKNDDTVESALTVADYQTYTAWGGAGGFNIIGLAANTTYTVKVKATQGRFTESAYGPTASAATVGQQITFSLSTNSEAMGNLLPATVTNSPTNVTTNLATNGDNGGTVYIAGKNTGLKSATTGFTIASATADLAAAATGFGVQGVSTTQSSGGPLTTAPPYNGSAQNVGITNTVLQTIFQTTAPIVGGQGVFVIKAKAASTTPAASDYLETLTIVAAAIF